jgi:hypothetical protein
MKQYLAKAAASAAFGTFAVQHAVLKTPWQHFHLCSWFSKVQFYLIYSVNGCITKWHKL